LVEGVKVVLDAESVLGERRRDAEYRFIV
jgi:hypothetical protein